MQLTNNFLIFIPIKAMDQIDNSKSLKMRKNKQLKIIKNHHVTGRNNKTPADPES